MLIYLNIIVLHLEHLDSLGERHANRLMSWVRLYVLGKNSGISKHNYTLHFGLFRRKLPGQSNFAGGATSSSLGRSSRHIGKNSFHSCISSTNGSSNKKKLDSPSKKSIVQLKIIQPLHQLNCSCMNGDTPICLQHE